MRRGEQRPRAFQAPVDVHASADGQVYMFKRRPNESTPSSDDDELDVMEMRPRIYQEPDRLRNVQLLEREVADGDSLNKLALQYGCKVKTSLRVLSKKTAPFMSWWQSFNTVIPVSVNRWQISSG